MKSNTEIKTNITYDMYAYVHNFIQKSTHNSLILVCFFRKHIAIYEQTAKTAASHGFCGFQPTYSPLLIRMLLVRVQLPEPKIYAATPAGLRHFS